MKKTRNKLRRAGAAMLLGVAVLGAIAVSQQQVPSRKGYENTKAEQAAWEDHWADQPHIPLNTATYDQLVCIPGIGDAAANRILTYRANHGPFAEWTDLDRVEGLSEKQRTMLQVHGVLDSDQS